MSVPPRHSLLPLPRDVHAAGQLVHADETGVRVLAAARLAATACGVSLAALLDGITAPAVLARAICCHVLVRNAHVRLDDLATRLRCDPRTIRRALDRCDTIQQHPTRFAQDAPLLDQVRQQYYELQF